MGDKTSGPVSLDQARTPAPKKVRKLDPELAAMHAIDKILYELDGPECWRVLAWCCEKYGRPPGPAILTDRE